jgi:mono/diheme cytochrome c family protein
VAATTAPAGPTAKGPPNKQETRRETTPSEAAKLDANTRTAAKQGADTRDTARSGAVAAAPAVRKTAKTTATPSRDTSSGASAASRTAATTPSPAPAAGAADTGRASASGSTAAESSSTTANGAASGASGSAGTTPQQSAQAAGTGNLTASPAAYQGWKMFHVYCYRCHGTDAMGSDLAPNLRHSVSPQGSVTHEVFVTTVKEGRIPKGMPSWKAVLSDEQIENLYAYLKARSNGSLAAGRPKQGS